jgi:hypothetical protein
MVELSIPLIDFMKAFDKVPHIRLINKLRSYGISNQTCVWVKNFLSNCKQRVQLNGSVSKWPPLKEVVDIILDYFIVTLIGNIPV